MHLKGGNYSNVTFEETPGTQTFNYSNSVQEYTVPLNATKVKITAVGGSGSDAGESFGGRGANISAVANVSSLSTLYVITGPSGVDKPSGDTSNAGVRGYFYEANVGYVYGGNGGGYSGVYSNSNLNITTALVIAGGGGGAGGITGYGSVANGGNAGLYNAGSGENGYGALSNISYSGRSDSLSNALTGANMVYFIGDTGNHTLNLHVTSNTSIKLQTNIESVDSNASGASNTYVTSYSYVSNGGFARTGTATGTSGGGGGGGAGGSGNNAGSVSIGANGGPGRLTSIYGNTLYLAGGGGGGGSSGAGVGGIGGGGNGVTSGNGFAGATNTGSGGGGSGNDGSVSAGGAGGSGIVILRYVDGTVTANGGTIANINISGTDYKVHTFTSNANFEISNATIGTLVDYVIVGGGGGAGGQFDGTLAGTIGSGGGGAGEFREGKFAIFDIQNYTVTIGAGGRGGGGATSNVELRNGGTGGNSSVVSADGLINILSTGGSGGGYYNTQGRSGSGSGGGGGGRASTPPGVRYLTSNVNVSASYQLLDSGDDLVLPSDSFGTSDATVTTATMTMDTATITSRAGNGAVTFTDNNSATKRYGDGGNIRSSTASRGVQSNAGLDIISLNSNGVSTYAGWGSYVNGNGVLDGAGGGGGGSGYRSGGGGASGNITQVGGGGGGASWSATGDITWNGYNDANANGYVRFDVIENRKVFSYNGLPQKFIVPNNAAALRITAVGAKGGNRVASASGGNGANLTTTVIVGQNGVVAGGILTVVVGGSPGTSATAVYGYGGNGGIQANTSRNGTAGGGLSGVFTGSTPSTTNALIVAGGGGGTGAINQFPNGGASGISYPGDASDGQAADGSWPGTGGKGGKTSTSTGGAIGTTYDAQAPGQGPTAGIAIQGGRGGRGNRTTDFGGGGGGGGYYAGGGGSGGGQASGGGGGGSSYTINPAFYGTVNSANGSHGSVIIDTIFGSNNTVTYNYTGNIQVYVPPAGATKILVNAVGASGANGRLIGVTDVLVCPGGGGANITSVVNVTPGTPYYVVVGGTSFNSNVAAYGFGGSGGYTYNSTTESYNVGGAGGGLTGLFTTSTPSYANALVIAGGGGGGAAARTNGGATNPGGNAASSGSGNGSNGGEDNTTTFGRNAGVGGSITTTTAGAAGSAFDPNTINPTAGSGINGGNGGVILNSSFNSGGGGGAGAFGGGGGAAGGDASGGGGAGATFFGNNTTSQQTYGSLNYGHGFMTITVIG